MDITRVLTISTAHITEETNNKLQDNGEFNFMALSVYKKGDYGYWIYVDLPCTDIPKDLKQCLELALKHDCQWLCLDCDGEEVQELPTYNW